MPRWRHPLVSGSLVAIMLAGGLVAQTALRAQETRSSTRLTTEHYLDWERVSDAQISPDGSRLVYTRQHVNQLEDKWESALWIVNADGSNRHRVVANGHSPAWSRDGQQIAFMRPGTCGKAMCVEHVTVAFTDGTQQRRIGPPFRGERRLLWLPDPLE